MTDTDGTAAVPHDQLPRENVQRGTVFALLALPAGVIAWLILWNFGFIASIVAFGIAIAAVWLYRFGSGGRVGRSGAIRVTVITIATLLIAYVAGYVWVLLPYIAEIANLSWAEVIVLSQFWSAVAAAIFSGDGIFNLVLALLFGALGSFSVLRSVFKQTKADAAAEAAAIGNALPWEAAEPPTFTRPGAADLDKPAEPDERPGRSAE